MKRVPELRDLSDDHHAGLVLARRCRRAGAASPGPAATEEILEEVREAFALQLEPHFRIEEQHLLPALEAIGEAALARRIREDHRALRALRDAMTEPGSVRQFGELLEGHIRFEERHVFEATQHRLAPRALQAIASAYRAVSRTSPPSLRR